MRIRHNSSFRSRRPRPRREWVASTSGYGTGITATALVQGTVSAFPLVQADAAVTAVGDPQLDAFTVFCVIGDFYIQFQAGAGTQYVAMGIRVVDVNNGVADIFDPSLTTNAEESWMWLRHFWYDTTAAVGSAPIALALPAGNHIVVKSKRKLTPGQRVVLFVQALTFSGASVNPQFAVKLRSLVGRAI